MCVFVCVCVCVCVPPLKYFLLPLQHIFSYHSVFKRCPYSKLWPGYLEQIPQMLREGQKRVKDEHMALLDFLQWHLNKSLCQIVNDE